MFQALTGAARNFGIFSADEVLEPRGSTYRYHMILTRGWGKVLEQTGGQMSVRGTKQRAVIFLLRYLGI